MPKCLCTIDLVLESIVEISPREGVQARKPLRESESSTHTTQPRDERKKKEKQICLDLVAHGRSDSSLWSEAQTCLDLRQTW
jgi:hypothetical protein